MTKFISRGSSGQLPLILPSVFDFCRLIAAEENGPDNFSTNRFPKDKISVGKSELNNIFV